MNKKLKKGIFLGGIISFIAILLVFASSNKNYVEAKDKGKEQVHDYTVSCVKSMDESKGSVAEGFYNIQYIIDDEEPHIAQIKVSDGAIKITSVTSGKDRIKTPENAYLGVEITHDKPLTIEISGDDYVDILFTVVVAKTDSHCMSWDDYVAAGGDEGPKTNATYTANIEVHFPDLTETTVNDYLDNPHYCNPSTTSCSKQSNICTFLRTGDKSIGQNASVQFTSDIFDMWNVNGNSGYYQEIAEYCYKPMVSYVYGDETVKDIVEAAIEGYYFTNVSAGSVSEPETESFKNAFEAARDAAIELGKGHNYKKFNSSSKKVKSLSCDPKYVKVKANNDYDFSANKTYYYAKETETTKLTYLYEYTSGKKESDSEKACTRTCEEAVEVEYGPPAATTAGMCFDYRVRITSRVRCQISNQVERPKKSDYPVCEPVPYCNNIPGKTHQGGPEEEFDLCINNCDGGKYSQKCSKKCYNEVYGNFSQNKLLTFNNDLNNEAASKLKVCIGSRCIADEGRYEWDSEGHIIWNPAYNFTYARYYSMKQKERTIGEDYVSNGSPSSNSCEDHGSKGSCYSPRENGFKRNRYGDTDGDGQIDYCHDPCHWTGCKKKTWLNPEDAEENYARNLKIYKEAIKTCKASATCTTKTAEFIMKTSFEDKSGVKHTIDYPSNNYPTKLDSSEKIANFTSQLQSNEDKSVSNPAGLKTSSGDTVIYDYSGCYVNPSAKREYMTEITFPGTWKNNKTQEISYEDKSNQKGWYLDKAKFCVPFDVKNTNTEWWYWYHNEIARQSGKSYMYYDDNCFPKTEYVAPTVSDNIKAKIRNFGYFGWNIDISCFYAVVSEGDSSEEKSCDPHPLDYRVRSVDNSNLFPDPNENVSVGGNAASTGRTPGFNWTSAATISEIKATTKKGTSSYYVNPELLIAKIQKRGDKIYGDDEKYLDYEFILTPDILNALREYNRKYSYTVFNGEFWDSKEKIDQYGLILYKSNLFDFHGTESVDTGSVVSAGSLKNSPFKNLLGSYPSKYVKAVGNVGCNNDGSGESCESTGSADE